MPPRGPPAARSVFRDEEFGAEEAQRCRPERGLAENLTCHGAAERRCALARNPNLDADLIARLARDKDGGVRHEVAVRPDLTEERRAAIPYRHRLRMHM